LHNLNLIDLLCYASKCLHLLVFGCVYRVSMQQFINEKHFYPIIGYLSLIMIHGPVCLAKYKS